MTYPIKAFDYESSFTIIIDGTYSIGLMQIAEISDINCQGYHFVKCEGGVLGMQFKASSQSESSTIFKSKDYRSNPLLVFVQDATGNGTWSLYIYIDGILEGGPVPKKPYQGQVVCYRTFTSPTAILTIHTRFLERILHYPKQLSSR
jgi:hypothetical protein